MQLLKQNGVLFGIVIYLKMRWYVLNAPHLVVFIKYLLL